MSKEEAIEHLNNKVTKLKENIEKGYYYGEQYHVKKDIEAIETVLEELNNSIPKHYIQEKIDELKSYKGLVMYEKYNYEVIIRHLYELLEGKYQQEDLDKHIPHID